MAGLVAYASSDEEDDEVQPQTQQPQTRETVQRPRGASGSEVGTAQAPAPSPAGSLTHPEATAEPAASRPPPTAAPPAAAAKPEPTVPPPSAPTMGPSLPPVGAFAYAADAPAGPLDAASGPSAAASAAVSTTSSSQPPLSPYSAGRALVRELTLPAVPDFDIPPSPPGSPPPGAAALDAKVRTFLELKRARGTHFNARIAQSAALRNPALMDKLLGFVGVETSWEAAAAAAGAPAGAAAAAQQYATTLPAELWDPEGFPAWAYRGPLRRAQERVQRERARAPGEPLEFVSAGGVGGGGAGGGSRAGTPAAVTGKRKSRFDT